MVQKPAPQLYEEYKPEFEEVLDNKKKNKKKNKNIEQSLTSVNSWLKNE